MLQARRISEPLRRLTKSLVRRVVPSWIRSRVAHHLDGMHRIRTGERRCYPDADFSVHMVTCHGDVEMALWCLKSFTRFAGLSPAIVIHGDGSLTSDDQDLLRKLLPRCTVIDRSEADRRVDDALKDHPRSQRMRGSRSFYCSLKLFDAWVYSTADVVVLLDSDVLFFKRPDELLECIEKGQACFNSDSKDSYAAGTDELRSRLGIEVLPRVNAGLIALRRDQYDLDLIENYFEAFQSPIPNPNRHEQTLYAIMLSRCAARRLSEAYQISHRPIGAATVSHHFVNDGSREHFSTKGVRTLRWRGTARSI